LKRELNHSGTQLGGVHTCPLRNGTDGKCATSRMSRAGIEPARMDTWPGTHTDTPPMPGEAEALGPTPSLILLVVHEVVPSWTGQGTAPESGRRDDGDEGVPAVDGEAEG